MSNLTTEQVARIIALIEDGRTQTYVANLMNINQSSVSRAVSRYRETGNYRRRPVFGRPRCTSRQDDRYLRLQALRLRHVTARQLQNDLNNVRNTRVSSQTVRNRLRESGIRARVAVTVPHLTRAHRVARLRFAREHVNWTINDWAHVLFTDESRFSLFASDRRIPVYRRDGERYSECNMRPNSNFRGGSIMVWGGISINGRTELAVVNGGAMTADRYIRDILEPYVVPFEPYIGDGFILMHDNARPHVARIVSEYLEEVGLEVLDWPAVSPDMNPIEHVWDHLLLKLKLRNVAPRNLLELEHAIVEEWDNLDEFYIRRLIESMPNRMRAVIRARGGNTRY